MEHYIYKITNSLNGKYYLGKRSCKGLAVNDSYMGSGINISRAIKKYGKDNFTKEILAYCESESDAYELEELVVTQEEVNDTMCYNLRGGGLGQNKGQCLKGFEKGVKFSDEHKHKLSIASKNRGISQSTRDKMTKSRIGHKVTQSTRDKISKNHGTKRKINQICISTGNVIMTWDSITIAHQELGIGHISSVCSGKRNKAGGFKWEYVD